ncbi:peptidoglycan recognition protein family protein [Brachybacterium paraconglomeratum]|uniref:peptidoglycan recognition protein family protein n=1 Tax=Brachybacterium paraconglomeratum TaxID=173362 RepID=UPI0022AF919C|nr:N-acetylmuramoyl-L-alanine amidase [Brachybacterium paraconglomeratum]MCZ4325661.1 N-acetylmuramoyl-L-alanine amidase [Brachybacterium paraconglomeratum]
MWLTKLEQLADPKYGLTVKFEPGWKRRGASGGAQMKTVAGVLWHHDVSPRKGTYPLREMLRDGRAGLSGPLAHIGFDRDGVVHVIGAGKANHAGTGSVLGVVRNGGNTRLIGIEMTSAGTRPWDWTDAQLRQMPKLGAALNDIFGLSASKHWGHYEYSNGGKIDPAGLPGAMPGLRSRIAAVRFGNFAGPGTSVPAASKPANDGLADVDKSQRWLAHLGYDVGPVDGVFGTQTEVATRAFQQAVGITPADGRPGPATRKELEHMANKIDTLIAKVDAIPREVMHIQVPLEGDGWKGKSGNLTGIRKYYAHDVGRIVKLLVDIQKKLTASRSELTDAEVERIADAVARKTTS